MGLLWAVIYNTIITFRLKKNKDSKENKKSKKVEPPKTRVLFSSSDEELDNDIELNDLLDKEKKKNPPKILAPDTPELDRKKSRLYEPVIDRISDSD